MLNLRSAEEDETGTELGNQKPRTKSGRVSWDLSPLVRGRLRVTAWFLIHQPNTPGDVNRYAALSKSSAANQNAESRPGILLSDSGTSSSLATIPWRLPHSRRTIDSEVAR